MTAYRSHNMKSEKEEIQRKLDIAKNNLVTLDAELGRLEILAAPLNKQIADAQGIKQYLQARIQKLTGILARP